MDKKERRSLILHIVSGEPVRSQQELIKRLRERGVATTQATISRDIREIGLVKATDGGGSFRYRLSDLPTHHTAQMNGRVVKYISESSNLLVVHTRPGFAQSVAASIDQLSWREIIGTVGGDDTVLIVLNAPEAASGIRRRL
ncbi:MAG TPA: arginine repressor, partial [Candidatus Glassbacteria bacterium]|nr:arginine repressor [Candidatus Glassbacteria bacterium]